LTGARLAELREGVWLRPANIDVELPDGWADGVERIDGTIDTDAASLAARLWDLDGWAGQARELLARFDATSPDDPDLLAPGFELAATALRHLQSDPLLPPEILPTDWPGDTLRHVNADWDRRYRRQLAAWYRSAQ
jgi:phenylacetic acid degradation operon negative regulatory protein